MKLRLIEIGADGAPARCPGVVPPAARDVLEGTAALYEDIGFRPPWIGYLGDRDGDIVGACAFFGPPVEGRVQFGYQVFPDYQGRGVGTEMARQMLRLADEADPSVTVVARTHPQENPSTRILAKLGFRRAGTVDDPEDGPMWEWVRGASDDV